MHDRPSLTLRRRLNVPPARVFRAWTVPEKMMQWWGTDGGPTLVAETDLRVGGAFHVAFCTADGQRHDVSGIYRAVEPDRKLVFTWAWKTTPERESQVTITLRPDGDGTMLTLVHEMFADQKARDDHRGGWTMALDRLEAAIAP
jgi:uncharacterized protein YndB with AHSA1/START domain